MNYKLYAGLDITGEAKLFLVDQNGKVTSKVHHQDWLFILDGLGAEPGEMVLVELSRDQQEDKPCLYEQKGKQTIGYFNDPALKLPTIGYIIDHIEERPAYPEPGPGANQPPDWNGPIEVFVTLKEPGSEEAYNVFLTPGLLKELGKFSYNYQAIASFSANGPYYQDGVWRYRQKGDSSEHDNSVSFTTL